MEGIGVHDAAKIASSFLKELILYLSGENSDVGYAYLYAICEFISGILQGIFHQVISLGLKGLVHK